MNTPFLLLCLTSLFLTLNSNAQIDEAEPNNPYPLANDLPQNVVMNGQTCNWDNPDRFRVILPEDGVLQIHTTVTAEGSNPPGGVGFTLTSKTNNAWNTYSPVIGENGVSLPESFSWCCLQADTFYIEIYRGYAFQYCFNYTLSWEVLPAFSENDSEPNSVYTSAQFLPYNTVGEGHLSFKTDPQGAGTDNADFFKLAPPMNGALRLITTVEAESSGSNALHIMLSGINGNNIYSQQSSVGPFQSPVSDTTIWDCMSQDTIFLSLYTTNYYDGGYAYTIRYEMIEAAYANDNEINNTFSTAQLIDPTLPVEGNQYFYGDPSEDIYKFFKPHFGFLKIIVKSETHASDTNGGTNIQVFDHNQNAYSPFQAPLGANGNIAIDSVTYEGVPSDTFYIKVNSNYAYAQCRSYQLQIFYTDFEDQVTENGSNELSMYPNPSEGIFQLDCRKLSGNARLQLLNNLGAQVSEQSIQMGNIREVNYSTYPSGIYYLVLSTDDQRFCKRVVIE